MSADEQKRRIEQLRESLRRHDRLYYVEAAPEISDREYDALMAELRELEAAHPQWITPDSPTQRVGGEPISGFDSVRHAVPMLSIDNTYNRDELEKFDARVHDVLGTPGPIRYLVDPKIDGVACSLRYEDGLLALAATRGDGRTGDDVTNNVRTIHSVPLRLIGEGVPDVLEVRGEVYWPRQAFDAFNERVRQKAIAEGKEPRLFANPRNGAAGTLKMLDPAVVAERGLAFVAHGLGELSEPVAPTASETMERIGQWGVPANPHSRVCEGIDQAWEAIQDWLERRAEAAYETDGAVVKVDVLALRQQLGATSKYPRWCIAYKYETERGSAVLKDVSFQVGRTGAITPVAHFDAIPIAGTQANYLHLVVLII
ncbi:MAG: NAD-dependent DNA ligase LigA, partial [Phycisphaerae bacterium]